jgi:hypothetical protein
LQFKAVLFTWLLAWAPAIPIPTAFASAEGFGEGLQANEFEKITSNDTNTSTNAFLNIFLLPYLVFVEAVKIEALTIKETPSYLLSL